MGKGSLMSPRCQDPALTHRLKTMIMSRAAVRSRSIKHNDIYTYMHISYCNYLQSKKIKHVTKFLNVLHYRVCGLCIGLGPIRRQRDIVTEVEEV